MKTTVCVMICLLLAMTVVTASGATVKIPKIPNTHVTIPDIAPAKFGVKIPSIHLMIPRITPSNFLDLLPRYIIVV